MVMKDMLHRLDIMPWAFNGVGPQIACANAAAFQAQFPNSVDTLGYESTMFVLYFADVNNVMDWAIQVNESNVSAADAGTIAAVGDVKVMRHDGVRTKCPAATGIFTMTAAADEDSYWLFEYTGSARWVRLTATAGNQAATPCVMVIQSNGRREPAHV